MQPEPARADRERAQLRVDVIEDLGRAETIADEWRALWYACPWATTFQRPEWVLAFLRHLAPAPPRIAIVRAGARLVGLLPLAASPEDERTWTIAGTGPSDVLDLLAVPRRADVIARAALSAIRLRPEWRVLELHELRDESPLLAAARAGCAGAIAIDSPLSVCPTLASPDGGRSLADAVPSQWAARVERDTRASKRAGLRVAIGAPESAREHVTIWRELHTARWTARAQPGVLGGREAFDADALGALLASGDALAVELRDAQDAPRASCIVLLEGARAAYYLGGFDPAIARWSPLVVLLGAVVRMLAERGACELDFLRGAEPYKRRWGAQDRVQHRVRIERPPR